MPWFLPGVLGNLFGGPATRLYPFERREPFERARGQISLDVSKCTFCGACAKRCPAAAITVERQSKTFLFDPFRCIICEACAEICPKKAIDVNNQYRPPAYAKSTLVYNGDGQKQEQD